MSFLQNLDSTARASSKAEKMKRRARRQRKKIRKAKRAGDHEKVARKRQLRQKSLRVEKRATKDAVRSGLDVGADLLKAGAAAALAPATGGTSGAMMAAGSSLFV